MPVLPPRELLFPAGGVNRRHAFQKQPPFTTPYALNVRGDATFEGRARNGSRAGIGKAFYSALGSTVILGDSTSDEGWVTTTTSITAPSGLFSAVSVGDLIHFTNGTNGGLLRTLTQVTDNTITWTTAVTAAPVNTDTFDIIPQTVIVTKSIGDTSAKAVIPDLVESTNVGSSSSFDDSTFTDHTSCMTDTVTSVACFTIAAGASYTVLKATFNAGLDELVAGDTITLRVKEKVFSDASHVLLYAYTDSNSVTPDNLIRVILSTGSASDFDVVFTLTAAFIAELVDLGSGKYSIRIAADVNIEQLQVSELTTSLTTLDITGTTRAISAAVTTPFGSVSSGDSLRWTSGLNNDVVRYLTFASSSDLAWFSSLSSIPAGGDTFDILNDPSLNDTVDITPWTLTTLSIESPSGTPFSSVTTSHLIHWTSGANLGLERAIATQSNTKLTWTDALPVTPSVGDQFDILDAAAKPIRLLTQVRAVISDGTSFWKDDFGTQETSLSSIWTDATWTTDLVLVDSPFAQTAVAVGHVDGRSAVRDVISDLDVSKDYSISLLCVPYQGEYHGDHRISFRMDDTTPDATADGVVASLRLVGSTGSYSGTLTVYVGGSASTTLFAVGSTANLQPGIFRVLVSGDTITCFWRGISLVSQAITSATATETRIGFGLYNEETGRVRIEYFRVAHFSTDTQESNRTYPVASAGGVLYRESDVDGTMVAVSTSLTLAADRTLMAAERLGKLYIADHGQLRFETDGATDGAGTGLSSSAAPSFTAFPAVVAVDDVVVIESGTGVTTGTYLISSVTSGTITLSSSAGASATAITFRVERAPKIYDPIAGTLIIWTATSGTVPTGCPLVTLYRDRLVLGGPANRPQVAFESRLGDPLDWSTGKTDAARAVSLTDADAGLIGEPIVAQISMGKDYLLFGCTGSLWLQVGDLTYGGSIQNLSYILGIIDTYAWCYGPSLEVYLLTRDGVYVYQLGSQPQSVSREKMPRELINIDKKIYTVLMAYDINDRDVHIYLTPRESKHTRMHWRLNLESGAFWPVSHHFDHHPTSLWAYEADDVADRAVLLGCRDGYIRRSLNSLDTDDGVSLGSTLLIGPFRLSDNAYFEGLLNEISSVVGKESGGITWELYVSAYAEKAVADALDSSVTAFATGTWMAGLNSTNRPRARGNAAVLKLSGSTDRAWAMEQIMVVSERLGRQRVLV